MKVSNAAGDAAVRWLGRLTGENMGRSSNDARKGKKPLKKAVAKPVFLKVPCASCGAAIVLTFPTPHPQNRKRRGIRYACETCLSAGIMELPPGSMKAFIAKGARALFSADIESPEWKAEVGA